MLAQVGIHYLYTVSQSLMRKPKGLLFSLIMGGYIPCGQNLLKDNFAKMKIFSSALIIFDENVNVNSFHRKLSALHPKSVYLFLLSSNWRLIYEIESTIRNLFGTNIEVKLI